MTFIHPHITRRAIRFSLTGALNTGVHVAVATTLIELLALAPSLSNGVAFVVATLVSYWINTRWSFSAQLHGRTLMRFSIVSVLGLGLAMGVSGLVQDWGFSYLYGIAAVVLVLTPTNFMLHHFWTYR